MKKKNLINNIICYGIVIIAFVICTVSQNAGAMSRTLKGQLVPICVYIVMAISLNLVVGISGELSLGHAGFMCVGAFSGIVASTWLQSVAGLTDTTVCLIISMIVGGLAAGIAGLLVGIPVLRLRGDYLAIVTLAFGEIIRKLLNLVYISIDNGRLIFSFDPTIPGSLILNGPNGASSVTRISTFSMGFALIIFTLIVVLNLINSRSGRAIMACRDNRIAAESTGINVTTYKLMAFVIASVLAGMAGALFGLNMKSVTPAKFDFNTSILVLVFVVLGGIGNIWGSIIAAALLTVLPELLRSFNDYRMLVYAIVLILVMLATNNPFLKTRLNAVIGAIRKAFRKGKVQHE